MKLKFNKPLCERNGIWYANNFVNVNGNDWNLSVEWTLKDFSVAYVCNRYRKLY